MATIPTLPLFTSGPLKSGTLNALRDALAFWQSPPAALISGNAGQSTTSGAYLLVAFPTTSYNTDSMVTSTSRITIQTPGRYAIASKLTFAANATGIRRIMIRKNAAGSSTGGTELYTETAQAITAAGIKTPVSIPAGPEFQLAAGDTIEVFAFQNSGAALTLDTRTGAIYLSVRLVQIAATTSGAAYTALADVMGQTELGTEDLDTITSPGFYIQSVTTEATVAAHYPVEGLNGHLMVESMGGANPARVAQTYTSSASAAPGPRTFKRTKVASTWSPWREFAYL